MNSGFVDGHVEQTIDFDYDAIDAALAGGESEDPPRPELVSACRLLHHIIIIGNANPHETMIWIGIFLFVMGLHPNQDESGERIANGLGMSKPEWFRRVARMRRILKARGLYLPKIAGQWCKSGRVSAMKAALQSWKERGCKPMWQISEAEKKLNWIADHMEKIRLDEMTPASRREMRLKLLPILTLYKNL